jgi:very-short-patch-repair endonuclease
MDRRAFRVDPQLLALARHMRHEPAPAEERVWRCLRNRQLNGFKFRRQFTVDRYIADFYCAECRLVVELDGDSHSEREALDAARTAHLKAKGYGVFRCTNVDVFENLDGMLETLLRECEARRNLPDGPSPPPSPPSTREREPGAPGS